MFKLGDVVEFAYDGDFVKYKGSNNKLRYDIGTVVEVYPYIKVKWKSDGEITGPYIGNIRLLEVEGTKEVKEDYCLCLTKDEVDAFLSAQSRYDNEYYCSYYDIAQSVIDDLIAFKNKAKENNEQIQKALELLSKSGYTCSKN